MSASPARARVGRFAYAGEATSTRVPGARSTASSAVTRNHSLRAAPISTPYSKSATTPDRVTWNAVPSPVIGSRISGASGPSRTMSTASAGAAGAVPVRSA